MEHILLWLSLIFHSLVLCKLKAMHVSVQSAHNYRIYAQDFLRRVFDMVSAPDRVRQLFAHLFPSDIVGWEELADFSARSLKWQNLATSEFFDHVGESLKRPSYSRNPRPR